MIAYIGYFLILLGATDFILANFADIDLYATVGINLEGLAYQYSAYAVGLVGIILVSLGNRSNSNQEEEGEGKD